MPAAGAVDGAGGVHRQDLLGDAVGIELAPALVEGDPHRQRYDVFQKVHGLSGLPLELRAPFFVGAGEPFVSGLLIVLEHDVQEGEDGDHQRVVGASAVDHVLPDEDAHLVTEIVPAQGLDLDVLANHREAHVLQEFDVVRHGLFGGRGQKAVRIVSLVQDAVVEIGLVVQPETGDALLVFPDAELPHPEIGGDRVGEEPVGIRYLDGQIIEVRGFGGPEFRVLHRQCQRRAGRAFCLRDERVAVFDGDFDGGGLACDRDRHFLFVDVRHDEQVFDIAFADALHPHGAPDAGLARIPDVPRLRDLFAPGDVRLVRRVQDFQLQCVLADVDDVGHVEGEGEEAAPVIAERFTVEGDFTPVVDRGEVQEGDLLREGGRDLKDLPIIKGVRLAHPLFHAGEGRLRGEGDEDAPLIAGEGFALRQDGIVPGPIEVEITVSGKLRPWIFLQGEPADVRSVFRGVSGTHFQVSFSQFYPYFTQ